MRVSVEERRNRGRGLRIQVIERRVATDQMASHNEGRDVLKCWRCGFGNEKEAHVCRVCGIKLKDKKGGQLRPTGPLRAVLKITGFVLAGLFVVVQGGFLYFEAVNPLSHFSASEEPPPVFDSAVQRVALKFNCTCGRCDMSSLTACACPVAVEKKKQIEKELNRGTPEAEVIKQVHDRYGGIKGIYSHLLEEG